MDDYRWSRPRSRRSVARLSVTEGAYSASYRRHRRARCEAGSAPFRSDGVPAHAPVVRRDHDIRAVDGDVEHLAIPREPRANGTERVANDDATGLDEDQDVVLRKREPNPLAAQA